MDLFMSILPSILASGIVSAIISWIATVKQTKDSNKFIVLYDLKTQIKEDVHSFHKKLAEYYDMLSQFSLAIINDDKNLILGDTYTRIFVHYNELRNLSNNLLANYELLISIFGKNLKCKSAFEKLLMSFTEHLEYQDRCEHPKIKNIVNDYAFGKKLVQKERDQLSRALLVVYTDETGINAKYKSLMSYSGVEMIEFLNTEISRLVK